MPSFPSHRFILHIININTTFGHDFNNLHNCPINIAYVVDPKLIHGLALLGIVDSF